MTLLAILLGAAPSVALMAFFYAKDRYEPEPRGHIALAFIKGAEAMVLSWVAAYGLERAVGREWLALGGWPAHLFEAGVMAAAVEELAKWWAFLTVVYRWQEFDEPLDGVVYGVAVALGLATVENVLVVEREGLTTGVLRAVFTVPAHALCGAAMGYFLGRAKLGRGRYGSEVALRDRIRRGILALIVPVAFHAAFDFTLLEMRNTGRWIYVVIGALSVGVWALVLRAVKEASHDSPFRRGTQEMNAVKSDFGGDR